jgi:ubiquitin carboxyl-terminal hydrolase 7
VQEFSRVLLDNLDETLSKCVPKQAPLTSLFEGQQQMYIECVNVSYASTRVESFLDLSLNVRNSLTLERSFREYVAVERMEGVNQYRAKDAAKGIDFGMQDARKGIRFLKFPQVLQLQLKRSGLIGSLTAGGKMHFNVSSSACSSPLHVAIL